MLTCANNVNCATSQKQRDWMGQSALSSLWANSSTCNPWAYSAVTTNTCPIHMKMQARSQPSLRGGQQRVCEGPW